MIHMYSLIQPFFLLWDEYSFLPNKTTTEKSSNDVIRLKNNRNKPLKDDPLTVIGYGQVTENGVTSTVLQEAKVLAYSGADCIKSYQGETTKVDIATMLCAAGPNGADSCKGDSGGPLIDSWGEQVGIVSWVSKRVS